MIKHGYENINIDNPLEGKLEKLIDYFVEFYGEENRKLIEERIHNTQFAFIDHSVELGIDDIKKHFKSLLSKATSKEDREYLESEEKRLTELYYSTPVKRANKMYNRKIEDMVSQYIASKMGISAEDKIEKLKKVTTSFVQLISTPREEISQGEWDFYTVMLGYFSDLAGEVGDKEISKEGEKKIRSLLGEDSKKLAKEVAKIEDMKFDEILNDKKYQDLFQGLLDSDVIGIQSNISFIKNFMLVENQVGGGQCTSVAPKQPRKPVSLCMNSGTMDMADSSFVHEVNHIVSADSRYVDGYYETRCGFNALYSIIREDGRVLDLTSGASWDRFESLNEIVNDYLSNKIYRRMAEDGFRIGFVNERASIYSSVFPVVEMLFEEHLDELKKTFITGKNVFAEKIGEKNFNQLADAVSELLKFCADYDKFQRAYKIIQKKQKDGNYFDIFDLAYDESIEWNDSLVEKYLDSVRKIDEINCDIDDYLDTGDYFDENDIE